MMEYCCPKFEMAIEKELIVWDTVDGEYAIGCHSIDDSTWKKVESKEENLTRDKYVVDATLTYMKLYYCLFCGSKL